MYVILKNVILAACTDGKDEASKYVNKDLPLLWNKGLSLK